MRQRPLKRPSVFSGISKLQNMGFGLVVILVLAVYACLRGDAGRIPVAIVTLSLIALVCPSVLTPFSAVWHELSRILGRIMTPVWLVPTYFLIITPVGLLRRIFGKDQMQLRQFGKSRESALTDRNHEYTKDDFINTF
ncbi:MAG: hypothetical protein LBD21_07295 [Tannerellaceae bacterium]|jgi:hypothetical protein|nr:hypothetical protein [Tannerellaceae bacterium]